MKYLRAALLAAPLLLAGCNTNDALIPREDIGTGGSTTSPSRPVTQEDTNRLAHSPRPETGGVTYQQPLPPPQNSLEAQAQALQSGASVSPVASAPLDGDGAGSQGAPAAQPPSGQMAAAPQSSATASGTIRFLPIIGAPVQAVTPLSRQLGAAARSSGLTIKSTSDTAATHALKGYLSAFADGGKINVVYVWDILDASGARLHRIQGQESVPGSGSDPWAAVPAQTMETIGVKTISAYTQWLSTHQG